MNTSRTFRTTLLAVSAAVSLISGAVRAEMVRTTASGVWEAYQGTDDSGQQACVIGTTTIGGDGLAVLIEASAGDQKFRVIAFLQGWNFTVPTDWNMSFQIDDNHAWEKAQNALGRGHTVTMTIDPAWASEFVHQITAGTTMRLSIEGISRPVTASMSGATGVWSKFMDCTKREAPAVVASLTPGTAPTGTPFGSTAFAPPPAAAPPATPAAQLDTTEVGLITQGGVKHVRGLAGSGTAIMFVLDSGAADVQITRKAALDLALAGELVATGRTTTFVTATGATNVQPVYLLRSLTVGERTVTNVECNVTDDGDPLLGQSFLGRLGSWSIDNAKQTLVLGAAV